MLKTLNTNAAMIALNGALVACPILGCVSIPPRAPARTIATEEALAVGTLVSGCEWKAAARYDDGIMTISAVATHLTAESVRELMLARQAFHLPLVNPELDLDEFEEAIEVVEHARKRSPNRERSSATPE